MDASILSTAVKELRNNSIVMEVEVGLPIVSNYSIQVKNPDGSFRSLFEIKQALAIIALEECEGNSSAAAVLLKMNRNTLRKLLPPQVRGRKKKKRPL